MYVCVCQAVTDRQIREAAQDGALTLKDLRRDLGIATVFISHDISTVRAFCDKVLVLYGGTAVEQADAAAFASCP